MNRKHCGKVSARRKQELMLPWSEKREKRKTKDNIKYKDTKDNINYKDTKDNIKLSQFTLLSKTLTKEAAFIKGLKIALRVTVPPLHSLAVLPEERVKEVRV